MGTLGGGRTSPLQCKQFKKLSGDQFLSKQHGQHSFKTTAALKANSVKLLTVFYLEYYTIPFEI